MRIKVAATPPPIPGLRFWSDSSTVDGPECALAAAGVQPHSKKPSARPVAVPRVPGVEWRPYQVEGIVRMHNTLRAHGGAILGDDMGLGKTAQASAIASMLGRVTLVVCPAGVRHQWKTWLDRMRNNDPRDTTAVLGPLSDKAFAEDWKLWRSQRPPAAVVSYNLMDKALAAWLPGTIIFDEPHNYLQGRANTYVKTLWKYAKGISYKLACTGTPYLSKPAGLWQLLNILFGMRFGKAREFDLRYCNGHQGQWGWNNSGATNTEELRQRLNFYMVRRMKADVAKDLPKVTRTVRWCEASPKATAALANAAHTIVGLRGAVRATLQGKDTELLELVKEAQRCDIPTVVFTWLREDAARLAAMLTAKGMPAQCITGEDTAAERARLVQVAHGARSHVVTTYGASGQGLDGLQRWCSNVIYHAIDPVPAIILQASGRLDRIGQTMPVTETYLAMRDSVDEITIDKAVSKLDVWQQVLGSDRSSLDVRNTLVRGGLNVNDDAVLSAIFEEMSK